MTEKKIVEADASLLDKAVNEGVAKAMVAAEKRIVLCQFDNGGPLYGHTWDYNDPNTRSALEMQRGMAGHGKDYAYFTDDPLVQVGDLVIVAAPNGNGPQVNLPGEVQTRRLTFARVSSIQPSVAAASKASQWLVGRVDTAKWFRRVEEARKRDVLEKRIQKTADELRKRMDLELLAAKNPELAELMRELDELNTNKL